MTRELPLGVQDFPTLVQEGQAYVDKTEVLYRLVSGHRAAFLSRPRRFGKSLAVSTLAALFRGKRELFDGLWIAGSDYAWKSYPVISLDLSGLRDDSPEILNDSLVEYLAFLSYELGVTPPRTESPGHVLRVLVRELAKKEKVVVLVDEYDSPLVSHLENAELTQGNRLVLQKLFAILKTLQGDLRFVFLTGVSRFSKVSLFSGLNSLTDLSLMPEFATLLGLTEKEIADKFQQEIANLAEQQGVGPEAILSQMRHWYNGYRFAQEDEVTKVYNPWSVLNYLQSGKLKNYWFSSATPTFAIKLLKERDFPVARFEKTVEAGDEIENNSDAESIDLTSLLFQTGYLTVDKYDAKTNTYCLKLPNEEVRRSLLGHLFRAFVETEQWQAKPFFRVLRQALTAGDLDRFFEKFNEVLAGVPYHLHQATEAYYHSLLYLCIRMLGFDVDAEVTTSSGRIDMIVRANSTLYIFEFKIDSSAKKAIRQIKENGYVERFKAEEGDIVLVGANFSSKTRLIEDWQQIKM